VSDVTRLLDAVERGEPKAAEDLLPLVYEELRQLAGAKMASQPPGQTLQATALVHEAYLRLVGTQARRYENSRHFLAASAEAMRHILIDTARRKQRLKRGGEWKRLDLDEVQVATEAPPDELLAVDEALTEFAQQDPAKAELVRLRFYAGLSLTQAAEILGLSVATAKRSWAFSRAWLYRHLTRAR
jgi:RNA polymerase sigma factor (TIGR02999 family)